MWGKKLGLIVVLAAAVAMVAGTGSATAATKLCEVSTSPCPAGSTYPASSRFTVVGEFGISPLTGCEYTYKFETGAASGSPLVAKITSFTFAHCGTGFTVAPVFLNWEYQISVIGTGPNGLGKMLPLAKKLLGFEVNGCQYTTSISFPQSITGGGTTTASNVALPNTAGSGCVSSVSVSMGGFSTPEFFVTN